MVLHEEFEKSSSQVGRSCDINLRNVMSLQVLRIGIQTVSHREPIKSPTKIANLPRADKETFNNGRGEKQE